MNEPGNEGAPDHGDVATKAPEPAERPAGWRIPALLVSGAAVLVAAVFGLYLLASAKTNKVSLAQSPKPVSFVRVQSSSYRPGRSYVGTLQPWNSVRVGPQFVSAYVGTVLVRPGAAVARGEVLATLDCRESSAASREIAARARALSERQRAAEHEAARLRDLTAGGFASTNEAEQLGAKSTSQAAELEALRASMTSRSLEVNDCVLRAPFAGEIAERVIDPGAYVRPGNSIVTVIDRNTVRLVGDAPESDFSIVAPGTKVGIEVISTGAHLMGSISRRAPAADDQTRTIHFEVDVSNTDHKLPVGTTAIVSIDVGDPQPASIVPLRAAIVRGDRATLFLIDGNVARRSQIAVLGEARGTLYVQPTLAPGSEVVIEGRALLEDGDVVAAKELKP